MLRTNTRVMIVCAQGFSFTLDVRRVHKETYIRRGLRFAIGIGHSRHEFRAVKKMSGLRAFQTTSQNRSGRISNFSQTHSSRVAMHDDREMYSVVRQKQAL